MSIKIDFKGLFNKLCADIGTLPDEQKVAILKEVLKDSGHKNLAQFHSDSTIDIVTKTSRYSRASAMIESGSTIGPGSLVNKTPWVTEEINPSELPKTVEEEAEYYKKMNQKLINDVHVITQASEKQKKEAEKMHKAFASKLTEQAKSFDNQIATARKEKRVEVIEIKRDTNIEILDCTKEIFHKQFTEIVDMVSARNALGWPEQCLIYGAPGSGKTHLMNQVAKTLGVACYSYAGGPTVTEGKVLGFNNVATGAFVPGWFYKPYKEGGLCVIDEICFCDQSVIGALNPIDNSEYIFGNGERVQRHKDFYFVALDNTIGTGSTRGFQRQVMDAAARDRLTLYELFYDEELEQIVYGNAEWAKYIQKVRKYVKEQMSSSFYTTSRAIRKGAAYLAKGFPADKVAEMTLFKGLPNDQKTAIIKNVGVYVGPRGSAPSKSTSTTVLKDLSDLPSSMPINEEADPYPHLFVLKHTNKIVAYFEQGQEKGLFIFNLTLHLPITETNQCNVTEQSARNSSYFETITHQEFTEMTGLSIESVSK